MCKRRERMFPDALFFSTVPSCVLKFSVWRCLSLCGGEDGGESRVRVVGEQGVRGGGLRGVVRESGGGRGVMVGGAGWRRVLM